MRLRTTATACAAVLALALAACSTSVDGQAYRTDANPQAQQQSDDSAAADALENLLGGDLSLPDDMQIPDDLQIPDDAQIPDGDDLSDIAGVLGALGALGSEGEGLGVGSGCISTAMLQYSVSMMLLGASMGAPLTQDDVDSLFSELGDVPPEIQGDVSTLHQLAQQAVGADAPTINQIMDSDAFSAAMDNIATYGESRCGG